MKKNPVISGITIGLLLTTAGLLSSCHQQPPDSTPYQSPAYSHSAKSKPKFTRDMVDNLRDPSCGMPLMATVEDTLHYGGKVYGFCSDECRDDFRKNAKQLAKAAVMKK